MIAQSFAEIFFGNCATLGMPCVTATAKDIDKLTAAIEADPKVKITINLEVRKVTFGTESIPVALPDSARDAFLSARWDPIGELLEGESAIASTAGEFAYFAN